MLLGSAGLLPKATGPALTSIAYAQGVQRPVGFADIVEKVKPAVISVRVKVGGPKLMGFFDGSPPNSQMERFFRRFGAPDGPSPTSRARRANALRPARARASSSAPTATP